MNYKKLFSLLIIFFFVITVKASESINEFYSFVHYAGLLEDNINVMKAVGSGTILAEGPGVLSKSVQWGMTTCSGDPSKFDPSCIDLSWIKKAKSANMEIILSINTGQNFKKGPWYTPWVICGKPLCGSMDAGHLADCPPAEKYWQDWYNFVFEVVKYYDGSSQERPEIKYFMSRTEAASPYWSGTKEELFGHIDPNPAKDLVLISRIMPDNSLKSEWIDKAVIPIAYQALKDANPFRMKPDAKYIIGPAGVFFQLVELYEKYINLALDGYTIEEKQDIVDIALSSNFYANSSYCIPEDNYNVELCFDAIDSFLKANPYIKCHLEVEDYAIKLSEYYDHISIRCAETHPLYESTGAIANTRTIDYIKSRLPEEKYVWDLGGGSIPSELEEEEVEEYLAKDMFMRLAGLYHTKVMHYGPTWLYAPLPLMDERFCFYADSTDGTIPWYIRHKEADTFTMMAKIFTSYESILESFSYTYTNGNWITWSPSNPVWLKEDGKIKFNDAILFKYHLKEGFASAGWCLDKTPWTPQDFKGDCPTTDITSLLNIPDNTFVSLYNYDGSFYRVVNTGSPSNLLVEFKEEPFLLTWGGQDTDNDNIADFSDNCPNKLNLLQLENKDEKFHTTGTEDFWITAYDWIGNECDICPEITNPEQKDLDGDNVGDSCDNCPNIPNTSQEDLDSDKIGDICDNCPQVSNKDQLECAKEKNPDGIGDACDSDDDNDGKPDNEEKSRCICNPNITCCGTVFRNIKPTFPFFPIFLIYLGIFIIKKYKLI